MPAAPKRTSTASKGSPPNFSKHSTECTLAIVSLPALTLNSRCDGPKLSDSVPHREKVAQRRGVLLPAAALPGLPGTLPATNDAGQQVPPTLSLRLPPEWPGLLYPWVAPPRIRVSTAGWPAQRVQMEEDELHYRLAQKRSSVQLLGGDRPRRGRVLPNARGGKLTRVQHPVQAERGTERSSGPAKKVSE
jgi:hypothetical protein